MTLTLIIGLFLLAFVSFAYASYRYLLVKNLQSMWLSVGMGFTVAGFAAMSMAPPCCEVPPEPEPQPPVVGDFGGFRPHFQGFGARTRGGRGGPICTVKTLTIGASRTFGTEGSIGDCTAPRPGCVNTWQTCARVAVFALSGTSDAAALGGQLSIDSPFLTIAGATAPGRTEGTGDANGAGGFTLVARLLVDTHDVYVGHLRVRKPPAQLNTCSIGEAGDGGDNSHVQNVIFDHVTCSWPTNVNVFLQAGPGSGNVMLADSLIYEGLWEPAWGGICAGIGGDVTVVRTVFAHCWSRMPIWGSLTRGILANNLTYNGTDNTPAADTLPAFYGDADGDGNAAGLTQMMILWNVLIKGPDSGNAHAFLGFSKKQGSIDAGSKTFLEGNQGPGITSPYGDGQWATVCGNYGTAYTNAATCGPSSNVRTNTPFDWWNAFNMATMVENVRDAVLANAGARPKDRDTADARVLADVVEGDGTHYVDWAYIQSVYGGMPTLAQRSRPVAYPAEGPGTCGAYTDGSARSAIDCWLEYDANFGARRLENWPVTTRLTRRR